MTIGIAAWMMYGLAASILLAVSLYIDRLIALRFGKRRVVSGIILQNLAAVVPLGLVLLFTGIPDTADNGAVLWINGAIIAALVAAAAYLQSWQAHGRLALWACAFALGFFSLFMLFNAVARAHPLAVFWILESGLAVAALVMTVVYPRAIGNIKLALKSQRGPIILYELGRGLVAHAAWFLIIWTMAGLLPPI